MDEKVEEVVDAVASAAEEQVRQLAVTAVVLLSLGVLLAGIIVDEIAWTAVAAVLSLSGVTAVLVPRLRHWRRGPTWIMLLVVALVEVLAILLVVAVG